MSDEGVTGVPLLVLVTKLDLQIDQIFVRAFSAGTLGSDTRPSVAC